MCGVEKPRQAQEAGQEKLGDCFDDADSQMPDARCWGWP